MPPQELIFVPVHEKRLGGRMGLFGRITIDGVDLAVGSYHKLRGFEGAVRAYINGSRAITAGDQPHTYCTTIGLSAAQTGNTWPASCSAPVARKCCLV